MKTCPKCGCRWPDKQEYCICGEKLDSIIEDIFGDILKKKEVKP